MKIGIDLDGVVIDSETTFRTYEELYDLLVLKGNNLIDRLKKLQGICYYIRKFEIRSIWRCSSLR